MSLQLDILVTGQRFLFEAVEFKTITIGRTDPRTGRTPDVDLSQSKGLEMGVSRHHASMTRREGALYVIDENSANGTYLNGQRLVAEQPRIVRDGDDIRMGRLVMRVSFRAAASSAK
jgi:pSer/pThr/pTyr-binding forkhead associated (FHA) protein